MVQGPDGTLQAPAAYRLLRAAADLDGQGAEICLAGLGEEDPRENGAFWVDRSPPSGLKRLVAGGLYAYADAFEACFRSNPAVGSYAQHVGEGPKSRHTGTGRQCRRSAILIREVILDRDDQTNEVIVVVHWNAGRHTELRVLRVRTGRYPSDRNPSPVEAVQKLGGHWSDRAGPATMNRMWWK